MTRKKTTSMTIHLPTELAIRLKEEAERRMVSHVYLVRRAVYDWLEANTTSPTSELGTTDAVGER